MWRPDTAPHMKDAYDVDFKNEQQNASKIQLLANLVSQLRKIDFGQLEDEGETMREHLLHVRRLVDRILGQVG